jgi:hypothetical protein
MSDLDVAVDSDCDSEVDEEEEEEDALLLEAVLPPA